MSILQSKSALRLDPRAIVRSETTALVGLKVAASALRLASSLILTRLLAPEAFGAIGVIMSIRFVLTMVSDVGFRAFLIRHQRDDDDFINFLWSVQLVRNIVLTAVMAAGAQLFASAYGNPQLTLAVAATGLVYLFEGVAPMSYFLAERRQEVRRVSVLEFAQILVSISATIIAAIILRSYWAMVVGVFADAAMRLFASLYILPTPKRRFHLERETARELWAFAKIVTPSSIVSIFLTQTDKFFMAQVLPLDRFGAFMLATTLTAAVAEVVNLYTNRVFFPLLSETSRRDRSALKADYYTSRYRLFLFFAVGIGGLIGGGEVLIAILFDERYLPAATYLSALCLAPMTRLFAYPAEQCLVVLGFIKATLVGNVLRLGWIVVLGPLGYAACGPIGVVIAISTMEIATLPLYWRRLAADGLLDLRLEGALAGAGLLGFAIGAAVRALAHAAPFGG